MAPVCVVIELNLPPTLCIRKKRKGWGTRLTPEQQAVFVGEQPEVFVPIAGGWGRMGMTHIRLAAANEDVLVYCPANNWTEDRSCFMLKHGFVLRTLACRA